VNISLAMDVAKALARRFEGFYSHAYLCPAGVPTIGYGATYYPSGEPVRLGDVPLTRERAELLLAWQLETIYLPQVIRLCPGIDSPARVAAIVVFTFNLGASNLRISTLRKRINAGHWDDVPAQLLRWNKAGGRVLRGLTVRREAEGALI